MSALNILKALVSGGLSVAGACAMGGNMMAESAMSSINLQDSYEKALGYTDTSYTAAVDSGVRTWKQFISDQAGYGLCQWTYSTRKQNLLAYAQSCGVSVGDEAMQVQFCLEELKSEYRGLYEYLKTTADISTATSRICTEFERPKVNNISTRTKFAIELYRQYSAELTCGGDWKTGGEENIESLDSTSSSGSIFPMITNSKTAEAKYLAALLHELGYDVLWDGLAACITDYQVKSGLPVTGKGDSATWDALLNG